MLSVLCAEFLCLSSVADHVPVQDFVLWQTASSDPRSLFASILILPVNPDQGLELTCNDFPNPEYLLLRPFFYLKFLSLFPNYNTYWRRGVSPSFILATLLSVAM
jgi:hypothetical protein